MKAFKFRLQSVAKVRTIEMEQQAKMLALALTAVASAKRDLETIYQQEKSELLRLQELSRLGKADLVYLASKGYRDEIKRRIQRQLEEISKREKTAEEERLKLVEKQKRKQAREIRIQSKGKIRC
jgi:hypothetical protein